MLPPLPPLAEGNGGGEGPTGEAAALLGAEDDGGRTEARDGIPVGGGATCGGFPPANSRDGGDGGQLIYDNSTQ